MGRVFAFDGLPERELRQLDVVLRVKLARVDEVLEVEIELSLLDGSAVVLAGIRCHGRQVDVGKLERQINEGILGEGIDPTANFKRAVAEHARKSDGRTFAFVERQTRHAAAEMAQARGEGRMRGPILEVDGSVA